MENISISSGSMTKAYKTFEAIALIEQNSPLEAKSIFEETANSDQKGQFEKLSTAYLYLLDNQTSETLVVLDNILKTFPKFPEALLLKAKVLYGQNDFLESANTFENYINYYPNASHIRIYYARSLFNADLFQRADEETERLLVHFPNQPLLNAIKAQVEFEKENYSLSKTYAERAISLGDLQDTSRYIAGVSAMFLNNYEQAHSYLESLSQKLPSTHPIQKLFSIIQFKVGDFKEAAISLESMETINPEDFELYSSASYALIRTGMTKQAKKLISKAESINNDSAESLSKLGKLKLFVEDFSGIDNLIKSLALKPDQVEAKVMLVTAYLQQRQYDDALNFSKTWQIDEPNNPIPINLEAFIFFKKGEIKKAKRMYEMSLEQFPLNFTAHLFIKSIHMEAGNFEQAAVQMEHFLKHQPADPLGLIHLYLIKKQQGDTISIISRIEKEFNKAPTQQLKIVLAKAYNADKMYEKSASLLMPKDNSDGYPSFHWQILIESLLNLDDNKKTGLMLSRWQKDYPNSYSAIYYRILFLELNGDVFKALHEVSHWNRYRNNNKLLIQEALLNIKSNRINDANNNIERITDNSLSSPNGRYILGRIAAWKKKHREAKRLLTESYQQIPRDDTAAWLSEQIKVVDGNNKAVSFLETHLASYPDNVAARTQYANLLTSTDKAKAIIQYNKILLNAPNNAIALNNLALNAMENGNLNTAEEYANRAYKIAPNIPQILDTVAIIKLENGKLKQAKELLEKAHTLDTNDVGIALNYSKVLSLFGQKQKALDILGRLKALDGDQQKEILALVDQITRH
jgi:putative PEP-CTERM system TPR-repeat lipoprotein